MKMSEKELSEFKKWYTGIFSINYFFQGMNQSIFMVIVPIYLLVLLTQSGVPMNTADIANIATIIMLPWALKFIFGILSDRYGLKKLGRRKPWIIFPVIISGITWAIIPLMITPENVVITFIILGLVINTGLGIGDTALDGMILDLCPKEQLGRTQGLCWGFRSVGQVIGGPLLALLVMYTGIIVESLFVIYGILIIISTLSILAIREQGDYLKADVGKNLKEMFTKKRDWQVYIYSLFNAVIDAFVLLFLSLYLLIQQGLLPEGSSLYYTEETSNPIIYLYQANTTLIISIGIIIGSVIGGTYSDLKSRKTSVYLSLVISTVTLLLMLISFDVTILLFIAGAIGVGIGWRHASYSAVVGEMSKKYPEMDSTYYSIANSLANAGATLGLFITGRIFALLGSYFIVFLLMAIINNFGLIPFLLIKSEDYEVKDRNQNKKKR
jgi:PAT family beta-lactamase induction signal transducer AmpG